MEQHNPVFVFEADAESLEQTYTTLEQLEENSPKTTLIDGLSDSTPKQGYRICFDENVFVWSYLEKFNSDFQNYSELGFVILEELDVHRTNVTVGRANQQLCQFKHLGDALRNVFSTEFESFCTTIEV